MYSMSVVREQEGCLGHRRARLLCFILRNCPLPLSEPHPFGQGPFPHPSPTPSDPQTAISHKASAQVTVPLPAPSLGSILIREGHSCSGPQQSRPVILGKPQALTGLYHRELL